MVAGGPEGAAGAGEAGEAEGAGEAGEAGEVNSKLYLTYCLFHTERSVRLSAHAEVRGVAYCLLPDK
ncbi:hypothetical protein [Coleofasciculus sp. E1-EBD-02]|uniref:hypothetical protein n=1 Tax=Coleofasciculus sp. E1-EBD-02 TaxID=3068481 RepID=UPI003301F5AF